MAQGLSTALHPSAAVSVDLGTIALGGGRNPGTPVMDLLRKYLPWPAATHLADGLSVPKALSFSLGGPL